MSYSIIYADPPWHYNDKKAIRHFGAETRYPSMKTEDICVLPVPQIAAKDCVLFLWATNPMLLTDAPQVIDAWGFKYKTVAFCWIKQYKSWKTAWLTGQWTMGGMELCLLCTRGHPKRISKKVKQLIFAERTEHSKKPDVARSRILKLLGDLPRIELFARERVPGWDAWGNQVKSDITFEVKK